MVFYLISYLKKFIKSGFPNRKNENWKFLDISQIIKKNIGDLSYFNDYSTPNKIDSSIFVDGLEHNKIIIYSIFNIFIYLISRISLIVYS